MSRPEKQQNEKPVVLETCGNCGKPITPESRAGSFTSFLFSENRCKCSPGSHLISQSKNAQPSIQSSVSLNPLMVKPNLSERYEVLQFVGSGGMGSVWKAYDKSADKMLAVKVLRPELALDRGAMKRFAEEAKAAAAMTHANLASIYGTGATKDGSPYILMDFLEGPNLAEVIESAGSLELHRTLNIIIQVCEALQHAHEKGIVHRDVKPSNIILQVDAEGSELVKLVDFGIAKVIPTVDSQSKQFTQTGELLGSPLYMSPEQCLGEKIDARSDLYSLACVLYEALTGLSPFEAENPVKILLKHLTAEAPILSTETAQKAELQCILEAALQRRPELRYQDAASMRSDLTSVKEGGTAANARRILTKPSSESGKRYYLTLGLKRPTIMILVSAFATFCSVLGLTNLIAEVTAVPLCIAAYLIWVSYMNRLSLRAQLMASSLSSTPAQSALKTNSSKAVSLTRFAITCLTLGLLMIPIVVLSIKNPLRLAFFLGFAILLISVKLLINLGSPRHQIQVNTRRFIGLSMLSPFSYLLLSLALALLAVVVAIAFGLLYFFLTTLPHEVAKAIGGLVLALFAGLSAIAVMLIYSILVALIATANLKVLMSIVKAFLPPEQIPRRVNLLSLAIVAGFVATPIACLFVKLNFGTALCLTSFSLLNASFFLWHLLAEVEQRIQRQPHLTDRESQS